MLYRLKRLSITEERSEIPPLAQIISLGFYHTEKNNITIHYYDKKIPINIEDTLKHELMHMASTRSTKVGLITGLEIPDLIGEGLNEGYTQYLTDKYFKTKRRCARQIFNFK